MPNIPPDQSSDHFPERDASIVQLDSELWIDLDAGFVQHGQLKVFLTAREVDVLRILVQSLRNGRRYIRAQAIADRLRLTDLGDPEHAIEQTISSIRQKLGETPHHPRILHGRRGFGYRLFPDVKPKGHYQQ